MNIIAKVMFAVLASGLASACDGTVSGQQSPADDPDWGRSDSGGSDSESASVY